MAMRAMRLVSVLVALALTVFAAPSRADEYPSRTVHVIVPYSAGGTPDILLRVVAQALSEKWGQAVVLENRPGGNTIIGTTAVTRSAPDGYTLLLASDGTYLLNPLFYPSLPYSLKELAPVMLLATAPHMFALTKSAPASNVKEFVDWAKFKPGTIMYGSTGPGSHQRLAMENFARLTGIELVHVPYKGAPEATTAVLTGEVTASFNSVATILPYVTSGNMRTLGVASLTRSPLAPEIPTIAEQGVPGFTSQGSFGLFGPANLPASIRDKIVRDITEVLERPAIRKLLEQRGFVIFGGGPQEFEDFIASQSARWARVIKEANIKGE
jgi:tripartite-type tricarboxylate transporter receptor subunit TctC